MRNVIKTVIIAPSLASLESTVISDYSNGLYSEAYKGMAGIISVRLVGAILLPDDWEGFIKEGMNPGDILHEWEVEILLREI